MHPVLLLWLSVVTLLLWFFDHKNGRKMCAVQLLRVSVHERIRAAVEDFLLRVENGEAAAEVPALRALLTERLTAAAEEVVGLFEETVAEYEGRVERSEREICRQRRLLDALLKPEVRLHRADLPSDVQKVILVKEEQEELWSRQEEADINISCTSVPVKSEEDDEEKPQSSQLQQRQAEQMETEADGEDCGGPEPDRYSDPDSPLETDTDDETDDSEDDWKETEEPQSGSNTHKDTGVPVPRVTHITGEQLMKRRGEKPFSCSVCKKSFTQSGNLQRHVMIHTGEKPFDCSVCKKSFIQRGSLQRHMRIHTGEKPFSCSVCGKSFLSKEQLQPHMVTHSGEKPFSCSVCKKSFAWRGSLQTHMGSHAVEKRFSCRVCDQGFDWYYQLINHQLVCCLSVLTASSKENREDCGGPEPDRNSDPDSPLDTDTDDDTGV